MQNTGQSVHYDDNYYRMFSYAEMKKHILVYRKKMPCLGVDEVYIYIVKCDINILYIAMRMQ